LLNCQKADAANLFRWLFPNNQGLATLRIGLPASINPTGIQNHLLPYNLTSFAASLHPLVLQNSTFGTSITRFTGHISFMSPNQQCSKQWNETQKNYLNQRRRPLPGTTPTDWHCLYYCVRLMQLIW